MARIGLRSGILRRVRALGRFGALSLVALLSVGAMGVTKSAEAQSSDRSAQGSDARKRAAKAAYEEGERTFLRGDFRRSAESFEQAYRLLPHHSALWNAARAWMRAGEDVRAANLLERYLDEAPPDAPDRDRATGAIRELDKRLGRLDIVANDVTDVSVDGVPFSGTRLWVIPGEHVATGDADGRHVRKVISIGAGEHVSVTLEPPPRRVEGPNPPPVVVTTAKKPLPPWVFFVGTGLTIVGGGLIVVSGLDSLNATQKWERERWRGDLLSDAHAAADRTHIIIGTTVGIGILTGLAGLLWVDWSDDASTSPQMGARR